MIEPFVYSAFGSTALIVVGLFLHEHGVVSHVLQGIGGFLLFLQVPVLLVFALQKEDEHYRSAWNVRKVVFMLFSLFFYSLAGLIFFGVLLDWWHWIYTASTFEGLLHVVPSLTACGILANVLLISGFFAADSRVGAKLVHFFSMNMLMVVAAAALAFLAELTWRRTQNGRVALVEGGLAVLLFVAGLFNTHGLGGRMVHEPSHGVAVAKAPSSAPGSGSGSWAFFQPLVGGAQFVMLQSATWVFLAFALAVELAFIIGAYFLGFQLFVGIAVVAGFFCVLAEIFAIVSLFVFHSPGAGAASARGLCAMSVSGRSRDRRGKRKRMSKLAARTRGCDEGSGGGGDGGGGGATQQASWEGYLRRLHAMLVVVLVTNMGYFSAVAVFPVYLLSGLAGEELLLHWGAAVVSQFMFPIAFAYCRAKDTEARRNLMDSGLPDPAARVPRSVNWTSSPTFNALLWVVASAPAVVCAYTWRIGWYEAFAPWLVIALFHYAYIVETYSNAPELTGWREVKDMRRNHPLLHHIAEMMREYFSGRLVKTAPLSPDEVYLFGYHPHGIMPLTVFWLRVGSEWARSFPGVTFSPLTASVMHLVPVMRDVLQWMGGREVSRESVQLALRSRTNCLLIPGGQAEMMESRSGIDEIVLVTRHTGFLRLAMQEGVKLVPVLSIGEVDLLDNVSMPGVQRWFLKRIGFAAPFNPYGLWYLPIPRPAPVTAIVGRPITVPHCAEPSEAAMKRAMTEYFGELQSLFDRHEEAAQAPRGLRRRRLMFVDHNGLRCDFDALRHQWALDIKASGESAVSPVSAGHQTAQSPRRRGTKTTSR